MLPLHLQPESHIPLYIQLRDQLRSLVHAGDLRPGDRDPGADFICCLNLWRSRLFRAASYSVYSIKGGFRNG